MFKGYKGSFQHWLPWPNDRWWTCTDTDVSKFRNRPNSEKCHYYVLGRTLLMSLVGCHYGGLCKVFPHCLQNIIPPPAWIPFCMYSHGCLSLKQQPLEQHICWSDINWRDICWSNSHWSDFATSSPSVIKALWTCQADPHIHKYTYHYHAITSSCACPTH